MPAGAVDGSRIAVRDLAGKIKLIFCQRPEDAITKEEDFRHRLDNVVAIPERQLSPLAEERGA